MNMNYRTFNKSPYWKQTQGERQISIGRSSECGHPVPTNHQVVMAVPNLAPISIGLTRLCLVSDKLLCMVSEIVAFLIDRGNRGITMSRGYGGFHLNTTYIRAFFRARSEYTLYLIQAERPAGGTIAGYAIFEMVVLATNLSV